MAGEWDDDLSDGSELDSASGSCCEAVAKKKSTMLHKILTFLYSYVNKSFSASPDWLIAIKSRQSNSFIRG